MLRIERLNHSNTTMTSRHTADLAANKQQAMAQARHTKVIKRTTNTKSIGKSYIYGTNISGSTNTQSTKDTQYGMNTRDV